VATLVLLAVESAGGGDLEITEFVSECDAMEGLRPAEVKIDARRLKTGGNRNLGCGTMSCSEGQNNLRHCVATGDSQARDDQLGTGRSG
jgi:hypothetical protein